MTLHHHSGKEMSDADVGYRRGLSARTVQMIAIGGAIGTGLFYGTGSAIAQAGPAIILVYLAAGLAIYVVIRALGELLVYRPVSGSISEYAEQFLGRFAGFASGWTYWAVWITTCMAEVTVAGVYVQFWWPSIPQWVTAFIVLVALTGANCVSVKLFGEAEFWFSMIKVAAILATIAVGIAVLLPFTPWAPSSTASLGNLWHNGGVFPNGFRAALSTLQVVMFAYAGMELVGVTAGEVADPKTTLRKAINTLPYRIGLFYIGALIVLVSVQSWRNYRAAQSPFVIMFEHLHLSAIAGIVNFILLTAALSSCNSGLYATTRMLRSLAVRGAAPQGLQHLNPRTVPIGAVCSSALAMGLGVLINYVAPAQAFLYITSLATVGLLAIWGLILASHLTYRRRVATGLLPASDYQLPGAPYTTISALIFLLLVAALLLLTADGRTALTTSLIWLAILALGYLATRHRQTTPNTLNIATPQCRD